MVFQEPKAVPTLADRLPTFETHTAMDGTAGVNGHGVTTGSTLNGDIINGDSTNRLSMNDHLPTNGADSTSANNELHGDCDNGQIPIPIAICGMACRLSGGLTTPHELWEFLVARKDARCRVPETRYNISSYYSPTPKSGIIWMRASI
jgi:beta-ketoacyl synthase-like protein